MFLQAGFLSEHMKKFLFYLGHPAHYHNISKISELLGAKGHEIRFVAREKDVLFKLLEDVSVQIDYLKSRNGNSKLALVATVAAREFKMLKIARSFAPDLMVGTDIVITHIGKLLRIPAIVLNEDDSVEVPFLAHYGFKYASAVLSPRVCNIEPYEHKKVAYQGYHELAYLHPNFFNPDRRKISELASNGECYFIIRFAELNAHHDEGKRGITDELALKIVSLLKPHGRVYITSERKFHSDLEQYRINIHPCKMHHALYFATMYIGDSQTMAAEAAVLGTPSIRFNDFVGKLGYLEELEHKYQLTYGIKTNYPEQLYQKIEELLTLPNLKDEWQKRRRIMLSEKIDVAAFMTWLVENYPSSIRVMKENPDYQYKFR